MEADLSKRNKPRAAILYNSSVGAACAFVKIKSCHAPALDSVVIPVTKGLVTCECAAGGMVLVLLAMPTKL